MSRKKLYRDPKNAKLGGVCAGIAEYFSVEIWLVRLIVVSAFLFSAGLLVIIAYIAAYFISNKMPEKREWRQSIYQAHNIKKKSWQAGRSAEQILENVSREFEDMDKNIQQMEAYVTSFDFKMNREFTKKQ
ncbi:envelope stress response membrane protein PspC [Psychromonas ossibalaenae]|uniref:envelope stress response membrane protein PspC n=1 Tax=Psychromonas ossibalaenae TaxID=444922 RepID=UPI000379B3FD|nr:envelope stress response membrane protein PspC [Psychromonas ossibalaenae]